MSKEKSEFGRGLCYCLALFLCHSERAEDKKFKDKYKNKEYSFVTEMWFNCASDHLYDLEIPDNLPVTLKKRLKTLQNKAIIWGHGFREEEQAKEEDKNWAIKEAKELIRLIDKAHGVKTEKAGWN